MKIYFGNSLFSQADFDFNERLVAAMRQQNPDVDIYLPQENAAINDKNNYANAKDIAQGDTAELLSSDLMVAVLDGSTIDAGVAAEVGVAYAKHIPIYGLYTDSRQLGYDNPQKLRALREVAENQFSYINLYPVGLIKMNGEVVNGTEQLLQLVHQFVTNQEA
ncbi:hypothetical protein IV38_GL001390 [Lactobacillus selangorensis]|uniref:Nucleoside 2-deoxyribosyltransferase n=1 Tax=Lactobacillus selangorensis TaxID=81857 RepID=A0A0R2FTZ7_9LACO|nr:nucleoside 2-deoxyribosyltransferase [Lactobacillus selangorensis]KRN28390.1 hypothetical protein IV38_GL001390 [Lactobacillus selangorensis]KRN31891.1 hypothetical protein IV40_GL001177 [Lactobacillus selangorensis]